MISMAATASPQGLEPDDFRIKETSPFLGGGRVVNGRMIPGERVAAAAFNLVETMDYLYVRVVKARELQAAEGTGTIHPYVEVRLGDLKGVTRCIEDNRSPEWKEVFAFSKERVRTSVVEVVLKDKQDGRDGFVGRVRFELNEVPSRTPPDSTLAQEWHRLEDEMGEKTTGDVMLAIWYGTQADECFADALHSGAMRPADAAGINHHHLRAKVYHAPRLWYVRVNVIEAYDVHLDDMDLALSGVSVKVSLGTSQIWRTKVVQSRSMNFTWNEEFVFVAPEPFEEDLLISLEHQAGPNNDEVIGDLRLPLSEVEKRDDDRPLRAKWLGLWRRPASNDAVPCRVHVRACLDGGYHVIDESVVNSGDLRSTMKRLWKNPIGLLELGILSTNNLRPLAKPKGTCDAYCVAKYGRKWVRTRTVLEDLSPRFNEQYSWDVYDHGTVLTVGVFDNCQLGDQSTTTTSSNGRKDMMIGKVRIRLSALQTGRVYTHLYPLLLLDSSGIKKMGEIHLAIRFSVTSMTNAIYLYTKPLLPEMHYTHPMPQVLLEKLRGHAVEIAADRLRLMEPPLRKEVVEFMLDANSSMWSMRRSKTNFFRLASVFSGLLAALATFSDVCAWRNPLRTTVAHVLFVALVCFPELILPMLFFCVFIKGVWNYRLRPRRPPHVDIKISHADTVHRDELEEEFDTFPTSTAPDLLRLRYDRLRAVTGRLQAVAGDLAAHGERLHLLLSWRDPRATAMFLALCLWAGFVLSVAPLRVVVLAAGLYAMRHPKLRSKMPSRLANFFRRLPTRTDNLI